MLKYVTSLILFFFLTGCFAGIYKQGSVVGYHNHTVQTRGGAFKIGPLPSYWRNKKIKYRAVFFVNARDHSSITIDSWCQGACDDASLSVLTDQLTRGIADYKITQRTVSQLAGRDVLQTEALGTVDGRRVFLSFYVLKMNHCVFDFVYVSEPGRLEYYGEFKHMVQGFKFVKGPDVL
ncbi:MAG: hypothetical protein HQM16_06220 [Deltaproteobacteria bacterium]|nr:hypothetical protein [Deltaproteobacteria bacterium]